MSSKKSIIIGILIILIVSFATGCGFKSALSTDEFKEHMGALGYTINDTKEGGYESKSYVVASKSDLPYEIEYYEFEEEIDAKKTFKKCEDNLATYLTSSSENLKTTSALFSRFTAKSEKEYIVFVRVKNTVIFIAGTNEYQEEIDSLLEEINY